MKYLVEGLNRIEKTEERIKELDYRTNEMIESKKENDKRIKKSEPNLRDLQNTIKQNNIHIMGVPGGDQRKKSRERKVKKEYGQNVPKFHERYDSTNPRVSMNFNQAKLKENQTYIL